MSPDERPSAGSANLAVVVEAEPNIGGKIELSEIRVEDDAGRLVAENRNSYPGDLGRAGSEKSNLHTLLLPVSPQSQSLDLWLESLETTWSGQTETLTVKDVPSSG